MSILGSLLPGIREVRTPLALGYCWIAVAWLLWPFLPDAVGQSELSSRVLAFYEQNGLAPVAIIGSLVAYLLGVVMEMVGQAARNFMEALALTVGALLGVMIFYSQLALLLTVAVVVVAGATLNVYLYSVRRGRDFVQDLRSFWYLERLRLSQMWAMRRLLTPTPRWQLEFLSDVAERSLSPTRLDIHRLVAQLSDVRIANAWRSILLEFRLEPLELHAGAVAWDLSEIRDLLREAADDPAVFLELRRAVTEALIESPRCRRAAYLSFMAESDWELEFRDVAGRLPTYLAAQKPDIYSAWDRLASEADFRAAIALPASTAVALTYAQLLPLEGLEIQLPDGDGFAAALFFDALRALVEFFGAVFFPAAVSSSLWWLGLSTVAIGTFIVLSRSSTAKRKQSELLLRRIMSHDGLSSFSSVFGALPHPRTPRTPSAYILRRADRQVFALRLPPTLSAATDMAKGFLDDLRPHVERVEVRNRFLPGEAEQAFVRLAREARRRDRIDVDGETAVVVVDPREDKAWELLPTIAGHGTAVFLYGRRQMPLWRSIGGRQILLALTSSEHERLRKRYQLGFVGRPSLRPGLSLAWMWPSVLSALQDAKPWVLGSWTGRPRRGRRP